MMRICERIRHPKGNESLTRARLIRKFCRSRHREYGGQQKSGDQERVRHANYSNLGSHSVSGRNILQSTCAADHRIFVHWPFRPQTLRPGGQHFPPQQAAPGEQHTGADPSGGTQVTSPGRHVLTSLARRAADSTAYLVMRATGSVYTLVRTTTASVVATSTENRAADLAAEFAAIYVQGAAFPIAVTLSAPATHAFAQRHTWGAADALDAADLVLQTAYAMAGNRCDVGLKRRATDALVEHAWPGAQQTPPHTDWFDGQHIPWLHCRIPGAQHTPEQTTCSLGQQIV
jgi:hypothetical protein